MSDYAPHILLIDGDTKDREHYAQRLGAFTGSRVIQAASGRSGLEVFTSYNIGCVVLELDLPDMSGFEVLQKLLDRNPEIGVIVITHLHNPYLLDAALTNGAQAALYKITAWGETFDKVVREVVAKPRTKDASLTIR